MASNVVSTEVSASGDVVEQVGVLDGGPKPVIYYGFSVRETAGSTAVFRVRTGGPTGDILDTVSLVANESARENYLPQGLRAYDGLYFELVSGAVEGAIRHG